MKKYMLLISVIISLVVSSCNKSTTNIPADCSAGTIIAGFEDPNNGNLPFGILVIDVSTGNTKVIQTNALFGLSISPDGDYIAASQVYPDGIDLSVINIESEKSKRFKHQHDDLYPIWSQDQDSLIFADTGPETFQVVAVMDLESASITPLTQYSDRFVDEVHESPRDWFGDDVLLVRAIDSGESSKSELILSNAVGMDREVIFQVEGYTPIYTSEVSPTDESKLLMQIGSPSELPYRGIYIYNRTSNDFLVLQTVNIEGSKSPTWSPDGRCIAYINGSAIYLYSLETEKIELLVSSERKLIELDWGINHTD